MSLAIENCEAEDLGRLANNGMAVKALQDALGRTDSNFKVVPRLALRVINLGAWREWLLGDGGLFSATEFRKFITDKRPEGCQTPLHLFEKMIEGTDAWLAYTKALGDDPGPPEGNQNAAKPWMETNTDNIRNCLGADGPDTIPFQPRDRSNDLPGGTSRIAQLRRLMKETDAGTIDPGILERVKAGEITPNAAMVMAGFRLRSITVPDDPVQAARRLKRHFQGERLEALIRELGTQS